MCVNRDGRPKISVRWKRWNVLLFFALILGIDPDTGYIILLATQEKRRYVTVAFATFSLAQFLYQLVGRKRVHHIKCACMCVNDILSCNCARMFWILFFSIQKQILATHLINVAKSQNNTILYCILEVHLIKLQNKWDVNQK